MNVCYEEPVILDIVLMFLEDNYGNDSESNQINAGRICRMFLKELNSWKLSSPEDHDYQETTFLYNQLERQRDDINDWKYNRDDTPCVNGDFEPSSNRIACQGSYAWNYEQWKELQSNPFGNRFKLVDVFGVSLLRSLFFPVKKKVMMNYLKNTTNQEISSDVYVPKSEATLFLEILFEQFEKDIFCSNRYNLKRQNSNLIEGIDAIDERIEQVKLSDSLSTNTNKKEKDIETESNKDSVVGADSTYRKLTSDEKAKIKEEQGVLRVRIVINDDTLVSMELLLALKNIISGRIPNMAKSYITMHLFDKKHRSIIGFENRRVVGGITFRLFESQGFAEIVFVAVEKNQQLRGYGSRLMNHLKNYAQKINIFRFLTYADKYALVYFKKQGFTDKLTLDERRYKGYIKDYDEAKLMECVIRTKINYLDIPRMMRKQREKVEEKIETFSKVHTKYNGLNIWNKSDRLDKLIPSPPSKPSISINQIPGLLDAKWNPTQSALYQLTNILEDSNNNNTILDAYKRMERNMQLLKKMLYSIVEEISKLESSWPFVEPVDSSIVKDYYDIIKEPIDLEMIKKRIDIEFYRSLDIFIADFRRMIANCKTYNGQGTEYFNCAVIVENHFNNIIARIQNKSK